MSERKGAVDTWLRRLWWKAGSRTAALWSKPGLWEDMSYETESTRDEWLTSAWVLETASCFCLSVLE